MNYTPNFKHKPRSILVVGRNSAARAVVDALAHVPGVGTVRQLGTFDPTTDKPRLNGVDLVIEMLGGVSPAFALAMATMSNGIGFITANPLLMMVHGRVLKNAAAGQQAYLGYQAAGFGLPLAEMLTAARPERIVASFTTAASIALARMAFRGETLAHVSAYLKMQNMDLSDWGGKQTLARALAMRSLIWNDELAPEAMQRVSIEDVQPADVTRMRGFGLSLIFAAEVTESEIYAGPMAVASDSPLVQSEAHDVLVAETAFGEFVLRQDGEETARLVAGVVADVRAVLRSAKPALAATKQTWVAPMASGQFEMAYVRVPYAQREAVLACKPEILQDTVDGDGLWQAVVAVPRVRDMKLSALGGAVFPLASAWTPAVAATPGLRLVG